MEILCHLFTLGVLKVSLPATKVGTILQAAGGGFARVAAARVEGEAQRFHSESSRLRVFVTGTLHYLLGMSASRPHCR